MIKTATQVQALLDEKLSAQAVKTRNQSGTMLSYMDTYQVLKRLNECFGNLGWDSETVDMTLVSNPGDKAAYRAKVRITAVVQTDDGGGYMRITKEGTGWGSDKSMLNAHELAAKEAESDALKRAAMKFGMSLGLALYDKTQENVEEVASAPRTPTPAPVSKGGPKKDLNRDALNRKITDTSRVLLAQAGDEDSPERAAKITELRALVKKYGADTKEALNNEQAKALLADLEKQANGAN